MSNIIQVYLDLDSENGCWNCQNSDGSICKVNNIGTIDYLKGISHCGLRDWKFNNNGDADDYFE